MKEKYLKMINELSRLFDDASSQESLSYLKEKVNSYNWKKETSNLSGDMVLPNDLIGHKNAFAIFSDGACRGNPGPGAWGAMGQDSGGKVFFESSGVDTHTTNNRMEMEGALRALESTKHELDKRGLPLSTHIFLYSDSKYVVDGIEKWVPGWKSRGWKKADKKTPENVELWKELDEMRLLFSNLSFHWVKGHSGHPQNEYCDQLANKALDESGF